MTWPLSEALRPAVVTMEFQRNQKTLYTSAGFVGKFIFVENSISQILTEVKNSNFQAMLAFSPESNRAPFPSRPMSVSAWTAAGSASSSGSSASTAPSGSASTRATFSSLATITPAPRRV